MEKIQPRFVRQKDVSNFFGVTRGYFNKHLRPFLTEIPLGESPQAGVVYDIYDLHALADIIKERNGRPARKGENNIWDVKIERKDYTLSKDLVQKTGMFKVHSSLNELEKALKLSQDKRRKLSKPS